MKKTIIVILFAFLIFGCTLSQKDSVTIQPNLNQTIRANGLPLKDAITISGDERIATVSIAASKTSDQWQFPLTSYSQPFADVGLYSDAFIKLDNTKVKILDDGESIWLTPLVRNGSGVLFNAIYSKELTECNPEKVNILGKYYRLSDLASSTSFRNDDRWKLSFDHDGNCVSRIVVYMDGYFSNLKDDEQVSLFRNDNTILISFKNLENNPELKIIGTKVLEETANKPNNTSMMTIENVYQIPDEYDGTSYNETEIINQNGIYLRFEPLLDESYCYKDQSEFDGKIYRMKYIRTTNCSDVNLNYRLDSHRVGVYVNNISWKIITLNHSNITIGTENWRDFVNLGTEVRLGGKEYYLALNFRYNREYIIFCDPKEYENYKCKTNTTRLSVGELHDVYGSFVKVWRFASAYTFAARWADISTFSEVVDVNNENAEMVWENNSLRSIFIPRSGKLFGKLTGTPKS